jgi:peptide/nickel transport system substrate-binding protein
MKLQRRFQGSRWKQAWTLAAGLALVLGVLVAGSASAASKDTVIVYNAGSIDSLHPYNHSLGPAYSIWEHIMEPLVQLDEERVEYVPKLAESWELKGKEWVFKLRKGIKFHDGTPLTAHDVEFSFNRIKTDRKSLQRRQLKELVEMRVVDDHTIVLVTDKPNVVFLDKLKTRFVMSKAAAAKYGKDVDKHPIGTGPYKFKSFKRDGDLVLERNDAYWGSPKPQIKTMVWRKVTEEAARVAALEAGQADVINAVPAHDVERLRKNPRINIKTVPGGRIYFLALNPGFKPWDNKLVRQAANYCVDADSIVKNIFDGNGEVLQGPVGPRVIGYNPNLKRYPYDPKKARELLKKAGHPNGVDVKLHFSPGKYDKDTELVQVVASQMSKGGFRVELVPQEWVVFWGRGGVNGGKVPFYYIGRGSVIDADTPLYQYFRTGGSKRTNFSNAGFDALVDAEQAESDDTKRLNILQKMSEVIMEEAPMIPLYQLFDHYGAARNIEWTPRPDEKIMLEEMKIKA